MADFNIALNKTLKHEGGFAHVMTTGEVVNYGITHWTLRSLGLMVGVPKDTPRATLASAREIEFVKSIPMKLVRDIYLKEYWNANNIGNIKSQELANKLFDLSVNTGKITAALLLQRAINGVNWPGVQLKEDGLIGPKTLLECNTLHPDIVLNALKSRAKNYYMNLASINAQNDSFLLGWLKRLDA